MSKKENIQENSYPKTSFLDQHFPKGTVSEHHKELLGTDIPEGYFKSSKQRILDAVKEEVPQEKKVIRLHPKYTYAIAASIALLLSVTVWFQIGTATLDESTLNELADDTLMNSLFVEDAALDDFTNTVLVSEVMVKAEISEQNIENVFMNSLFVEDSLIDNYLGKSLLENIVL
jgi:hypothetical protein